MPKKATTERSLQVELRELMEGLRQDVEALEKEITALRGKEVSDCPNALLDREEAAERLGISVRTLDDLEEVGEIQAVRIRGRVLYSPETLDAFIRRKAGGQDR